jgi:type VI secretion system secreted protein Hcp
MAVAYYLKLDGIEGECQATGYEDQIQLDSWSWGASNAGSFSHGTGGGTGKVTFHDMHFSKRYDKSSANLAKFCSSGKHLGSAEMACVKYEGDNPPMEYLKVTLTDVVIASYQMGGSVGDQLPGDQFSINFAQIQKTYKPQGNTGDPAGNVDYGWNIQKQAPA